MNVRFRISYRTKGMRKGDPTLVTPPQTMESAALADADEVIRAGATFAALLRDSGGTDHPSNAGKFFLYRYIKA